MSEQDVHQKVSDYLRLQYPGIVWHTDFGSGVKLTIGQARAQKRLQGGRRAWPDLFIAEPRGGYSGLFIELKRDGVRTHLKNGQLAADPHIREQHLVLHSLQQRGYSAEFGIGFYPTKKIIDDYMKLSTGVGDN